MAVELHSGHFRYSIEVYAYTDTVNDEGGQERTYDLYFTSLAAIQSINTRKLNEAAATALLHSMDFYVRYSESRKDITTGYTIIYQGKTYVISEVLRVDGKGNGEEWGRFIRMTAAVKD